MSKLMRVGYEERLKLSNDVKDLGPTKLGEIVGIIRSKCPGAYKEIDEDNCQILVDNINRRVLDLINTKLSDIPNNKRLKTK